MDEDYQSRLQELGISLDDLVNSLTLPVPPYTVFLSGSVIEGYGNAESDIDIIIVHCGDLSPVDAEYVYETESLSIGVDFIGDRRIDVEYRTKESLFQLARRIREFPVTDDRLEQGMAVSPEEFQIAHQIRVGVPILEPGNFATLQQAFDYQRLSRMLMMRHLYLCGSTSEDAAGAIASRQHGTALLMSRSAAQFALDAFMAAQGETNPKEKWRFFKLEKLNDPDLLQQYWALEMPCLKHPDDVFAYAKQCLRFANQMVIKAYKARS